MTNKHKPASLLLLHFSIVLLSFTNINPDCRSVKNGRFHFYQNNGKYHSIIIRRDSLQTEVNLTTGDSTFWRISWISDCKFRCDYLSGTRKKSKEELEFYKRSTLLFNIKSLSTHYYTFNALMTFENKSTSFSDTMWFDKK